MEEQARTIAHGSNVYVKYRDEHARERRGCAGWTAFSQQGVKLNVTAMMTLDQVERMLPHLENGAPAYLSIFAGRVADTGRDPLPLRKDALSLMRPFPHLELLWAIRAKFLMRRRQRHRMPHHHHDAGLAEEALSIRTRPGGVLRQTSSCLMTMLRPRVHLELDRQCQLVP